MTASPSMCREPGCARCWSHSRLNPSHRPEGDDVMPDTYPPAAAHPTRPRCDRTTSSHHAPPTATSTNVSTASSPAQPRPARSVTVPRAFAAGGLVDGVHPSDHDPVVAEIDQ